MKKNMLLFGLICYLAFHQLSGSCQIIGEDTLYFSDGNYFKISHHDTTLIDTTIILVKYVSGARSTSIDSIENVYGLTKIRDYVWGWKVYEYSNQDNFIDICIALNNEPITEILDYNTLGLEYFCDPLEPDDPYFYYDQWYLSKMEVASAWNITTGSPEIIVGIMDSGFDWEYQDDLGRGTSNGYENILLNENDPWSDWNDPSSGNQLDDENNGYTDDYKGYGKGIINNPYLMINDVRNYDLQDLLNLYTNGYTIWMHGTMLAGIIGAKTNNGYNISGIAGGWGDNGAEMKLWKHSLLKSLLDNEDGLAYLTSDVNSDKVHIIEMAYGMDESSSFSDALQNAYNDGVFIVVASGNDGSNAVSYPARLPFVFAVGASDEEDLVQDYSNYGSSLDLCASSGVIGHLIPGNELNYDYEVSDCRTSGASAMVAGTAALMLSINPELSPGDITQILHETTDKGTYYTYNYEIDPLGFNEHIGYGRLNTHKAVCKAWDRVEDEHITANETWTYNRVIMNSVYVTSGITLSITGTITIQFGSGASLIIEPGATVIIDGATLTNMKCCNNENKSWPGIQVWGDRNSSQYTPPNQPCAQGTLILQNGAIIENASVAADLWKPGDYIKTGGIIHASDATFLNNNRSIHASYYRNFNPYNPSQELAYDGSFEECTFEVNNDYLGDIVFYKHVDLDNVNGLKFYGCNFSLNNTSEEVSEYSLAIAAYDAGFKVSSSCTSQISPCPTGYEIPSTFSGFKWAIGSYYISNDSYTFDVRNSVFDNNNTGIYISGTKNFIVVDCDFSVGYDAGYGGSCNSGIGIDNQGSMGFAIEDNTFAKNAQAAPGYYAGIRVFDCPSFHDIIYRNAFNGLSYGNYAEGKNRYNPLDDMTGVDYQCNYNLNNTIDFIVTAQEPQDAMIKGDLGSIDSACGNTFSPTAQLHFSNEGLQNINYYFCEDVYNCAAQEPEFIYSLDNRYFRKIEAEPFNCPVHYGSGGSIHLTASEREGEELIYAQNLNDLQSVQSLYQSLIDGGNTAAELSDIESANPGDMWILRAQLLGDSPHLSQEVLRTMSERTDVFPNEVLLEILSANPDELLKDTLLDFLAQKEDPLPGYMIGILEQASQGVTYKTILKREMAQYLAASTQAAQNILRCILCDSVFNATDYRNWLDNIGGIGCDKQIIASYLFEGDTVSAMYLLNLVPSLYGLEGQDLDNFNDYKELIEMQIAWKKDGKTIHDLDSTDVASLEYFANESIGDARMIARNILTCGSGYCYENCLNPGDTTLLRSADASIMKPIMAAYGSSISVHPNPACSWVAFDYYLGNDCSEGLIEITDNLGQVIKQLIVNGGAGQIIWDTQAVQKGIYIYTFISSGLIHSGKLIIQ